MEKHRRQKDTQRKRVARHYSALLQEEQRMRQLEVSRRLIQQDERLQDGMLQAATGVATAEFDEETHHQTSSHQKEQNCIMRMKWVSTTNTISVSSVIITSIKIIKRSPAGLTAYLLSLITILLAILLHSTQSTDENG